MSSKEYKMKKVVNKKLIGYDKSGYAKVIKNGSVYELYMDGNLYDVTTSTSIMEQWLVQYGIERY